MSTDLLPRLTLSPDPDLREIFRAQCHRQTQLTASPGTGSCIWGCVLPLAIGRLAPQDPQSVSHSGTDLTPQWRALTLETAHRLLVHKVILTWCWLIHLALDSLAQDSNHQAPCSTLTTNSELPHGYYPLLGLSSLSNTFLHIQPTALLGKHLDFTDLSVNIKKSEKRILYVFIVW